MALNESVKYWVQSTMFFLTVISVIYTMHGDVLSKNTNFKWYSSHLVIDEAVRQLNKQNAPFKLTEDYFRDTKESDRNHVLVLDLTGSSLSNSVKRFSKKFSYEMMDYINWNQNRLKVDDLRNLLTMTMVKLASTMDQGYIAIVLIKDDSNIDFYSSKSVATWAKPVDYYDKNKNVTTDFFKSIKDQKVTKKGGYSTDFQSVLQKIDSIFYDDSGELVVKRPTTITLISDFHHDNHEVPLSMVKKSIRKVAEIGFIDKLNLIRLPTNLTASKEDEKSVLDYDIKVSRSNEVISYFKTFFKNRYSEVSLNEIINYSTWQEKKILLQSLLVSINDVPNSLEFFYKNQGNKTNAILSIESEKSFNESSYTLELKVDDKLPDRISSSISYRIIKDYGAKDSTIEHRRMLISDVPRYIKLAGSQVLEVEVSNFQQFVDQDFSLRFYEKDDNVLFNVPVVLSPLIDDTSALVLITAHYNFLCVLFSIFPVILIAYKRKRVREGKSRLVFPNFAISVIAFYFIICVVFYYVKIGSIDFIDHHLPVLLCSLVFFLMAIFSYEKDKLLSNIEFK